MKFHPIANVFPMMDNDEFEKLKNDIEVNGLLEEIWLHPDGSILDGRNRWMACVETNTNAKFRNYDGDESPSALISFVLSLNDKRRHLTSSQRAICAINAEDILCQLENEAREKQKEYHGNQFDKKGFVDLGKKLPKSTNENDNQNNKIEYRQSATRKQDVLKLIKFLHMKYGYCFYINIARI